MIRALLAGTKTQTRRVMKRQKKHDFTDYTLFGQKGHADDEAARRGGWAEPWVAIEHAPDWPDGKEDQCKCPYASQRGDRLWVREAWGYFDPDSSGWDYEEKNEDGGDGPCKVYAAAMMEEGNALREFWRRRIAYAATWQDPKYGDGPEKPARWKPSIHMPRWASRIQLEVTDVRIQRLQEISEEDAMAEGITAPMYPPKGKASYALAYMHLWESINGAGSWAANPWIWAVSFPKLVTP